MMCRRRRTQSRLFTTLVGFVQQVPTPLRLGAQCGSRNADFPPDSDFTKPGTHRFTSLKSQVVSLRLDSVIRYNSVTLPPDR